MEMIKVVYEWLVFRREEDDLVVLLSFRGFDAG